MSQVILNGTNVGPVKIEAIKGSIAAAKARLDDACPDQIYFKSKDNGQTYVACGDDLNLKVYKHNLMKVDTKPVDFVDAHNSFNSTQDAKWAVGRMLPKIGKPAVIGTVAAGAATAAILKGMRSPTGILLTAGIAAGAVALGAAGLSYYRATHPDMLKGWTW